MLQTIIVGIDGRPQDAEALALARRLADPGAEIIATSVAVVDRLLVRAATLELQSDVDDEAEQIVEEFTEPRARTEGFVARGSSVGDGLARVARGARADLIVVASSRRGLLGRVFAGDSVSDVLHHAPCPVAVAPVGFDASGPLAELVVGYDGSDEADRALLGAMALAQRDEGRVNVVEVVDPLAAVSSLGGAPDADGQTEYDRARTNLDTLAREFGLHGVITTGRAATELARAAEGTDLLCIGLHERGILDRIALGSTAHALLRDQPAPLLICTPEAAAIEQEDLATTDALDETSGPVT